MRALIERLRAAGLRMEEEGPPPGDGHLSGKTFVLTGTLPDLTREQAKAIYRQQYWIGPEFSSVATLSPAIRLTRSVVLS